MAEYYLNVNGNLQKSQTINLTIDANTAYATVCWVGTVVNSGDCISDVSETYCESVYVGLNDSCEVERYVNGTINWNGCVITYKITQSKNTDCDDCGSNTTSCELIDAYVSPYYVPSSATTTTVFYQYWETVKNNCEVVSRKRKFGSKEVTLSPSPSSVACDSDDRTINVPSITYSTACGSGTISGLKCYVQKQENCCDQQAKYFYTLTKNDTPSCNGGTIKFNKIKQNGNVCYEINDIFYSPQKVDASGGTVDFFIDYKKTIYEDCKRKISYGRCQDSVNIGGCVGRECCKERVKTIPYTWEGHTLCDGGNVVNLKITQKKDVTYTGDCKCDVPPDKGYCVDVHSIKRYYKLGDGTWEEINPLHPHIFPYYGGTMKVSWIYSAITVGDDCYVDISSGNTWEDFIEIPPYEGDECDGVDYVTIQYVFKKSPCAFDEATKAMLPPNICGESCYIEADKEFVYGCNGAEADFTVKKDESSCTNEFSIEYEQDRRPCSDICDSCFNKFNIELGSGGTDTVTDTASCNIALVEDTKPSWLNVTVNGRDVSYSAPMNRGSNRSGGVTFKLRNHDCYDTIIVTQPGSNEEVDPSPTDPTIVCNCDTAVFEAYSTPKDLNKKGGEHIAIGSYIFNDCIHNVATDTSCGYDITHNTQVDCNGGNVVFTSTSTGGTGFITDVTFEDGAIYGTVSENTTGSDRTCDIKILCDVEGCDSKTTQITVKQKGK